MYKWDPADYHVSSAAQERMAMEVLGNARLRGDERVLDIGCGDGKITAHIAGLVPSGSVLGIDQSADMIQFSQANYPRETYPNLSFQVCDASRLRFEDEFDVIFSNSTLHWVLDHRPVLAGIERSLRRGGRIFLQMGGRGNAARNFKALGVLLSRERWAPYFSDFTFPYGFYAPEDYREWLKDAGLIPHRVELVNRDMALPGQDGLAAWIRTTWLPFTQRIPEDLRDAFTRELAEEYVKIYPPDAENIVHVDMVRLIVEAEKPASETG